MTDEEFTEYQSGRFQTVLKFYDNRACQNKFWHHTSSVYVLAMSVAIAPILTTEIFQEWSKLMVTWLSSTIAIAAGIASHFKFHENWLSFRSTWDALQKELQLRNAKIGDYSSGDRNQLFVERVESLISCEGKEWLARHSEFGPEGTK